MDTLDEPADEWLNLLRRANQRRRTEQERKVRTAIRKARERGDHQAVQTLLELLDNGYVARAHVRARDPEVIRLRRQNRSTAA